MLKVFWVVGFLFPIVCFAQIKNKVVITEKTFQPYYATPKIEMEKKNVRGLYIPDSSFKFRGTVCARSINNSKPPLYIVNGKVYDINEMGKLNPNDIKEVTILKGENATALYGEKGANGVIVITLKCTNEPTQKKQPEQQSAIL